jgi:ABC-type Fe3+-hydroxamate transport system substrate-binding protein
LFLSFPDLQQSLTFFDQMGNGIKLPAPPTRIVSLVPSQTELLFDLGLDTEVVGITKYCIHPPQWQNKKAIVGGTKNFQIDLIDSLRPDVIIGNKEENYKDGIVQLYKKYPVWMSEIYKYEEALQMIHGIGLLVNRQERADQLVLEIKRQFESLKPSTSKRVLYLIWRKPWMAAGRDTFINSMLGKIGLQNCLPENSRYPELTNEDLKVLNPQLVFLSSEPYPFKEKHIEEINTILPDARVVLVDGEMFSWYGSRLLKAPSYFNSLTRFVADS